MGNRTLNVLSIDFDFFQIVDTATIFECYPDGVDLPTKITEITWANHYQIPYKDGREQLLRVTVDDKLIKDTISIAINNAKNSNIPFLAANSHKHIYKFIEDEMHTGKYTGINIYNLDMHPDYKNKSNKIDCGNWLGMAVKNFPNCKATWVINPISLDLTYEDNYKGLHRVKTLRTLKDIKFDMIYLCRSDSWTPPHLDDYFAIMLDELAYKFKNAKAENNIMQPRNPSIYM